jgi:2-polyprenyl-6-methoxyphenol hydroxylase-like FAD-dependent oxidoreductase
LLSINETTRVTGVKLHWRDSAKPAIDSLIAALVVDASGVTLGGVGRDYPRWRHYEHLRHFPDGIVAIKDAVCVFNPVYGQGMTTAALGAMALDRCLKQKQSKSLNGFPLRFHNQLARILHTPWLMATREDGRWSTTEGAKPRWSERLVQKYVDRVSLLMQDSPTLLTAFAEVVHMVKPPTALFVPSILSQVLTSYNKRVATDIDLS